MSTPKRYLSWVDAFLSLPPGERREMAEICLRALSLFDSKDGEPTPRGRELERSFHSRDWRCIGVTPCIEYLKLAGTKTEQEAIFVHPFGSPPLLFAHRKLPVLSIVGSDIRFNTSVLAETPGNREGDETEGITG